MEAGKEVVARFLVAPEGAATEANKSFLNIKMEWAGEDEAGLTFCRKLTLWVASKRG